MANKDKRNSSKTKSNEKPFNGPSNPQDVIINPFYFFISGFSSAATISWAVMWLAFSLFIEYELLTEAIGQDFSTFLSITMAPIGLMFFVERKIRSSYPRGSKSDSFGQVLLMFGRLIGAFSIYIIVKLMYFPVIFPAKDVIG